MNKRSFISCVLIFLLLLIPFQSQAITHKADTNYIGLGDSIAYGLNADKENDYVYLFNEYLKTTKKYAAIELVNKGALGNTSSDLLYDLINNKENIRNSIKKADVITISIGGNNLLSPLIVAISRMYSLNPTDPSFEQNLADAIANDIATDPTWYEKFEELKTDTNLLEGVNDFKIDWPKIIKEIHTLAPKAKVYVMTVYNPLPKNTPVIYDVFDGFIQEINTEIKNSHFGYRLADVYTEFNLYDGEPLTHFDLLSGSIDPHPTNDGHELIFQAHYYAKVAKSVK